MNHLHEVEREAIIRALRSTPTVQAAAEQLGLLTRTLWSKIKRYGIEKMDYRVYDAIIAQPVKSTPEGTSDE